MRNVDWGAKFIAGYEESWYVTQQGKIIKTTDEYESFTYKPVKDERGYYYVRLYGDRFYYHRLVAKHFLPNPDNLPCVRHKDGDRSNNSVTNLEWCKYTNKKRA